MPHLVKKIPLASQVEVVGCTDPTCGCGGEIALILQRPDGSPIAVAQFNMKEAEGLAWQLLARSAAMQGQEVRPQ